MLLISLFPSVTEIRWGRQSSVGCIFSAFKSQNVLFFLSEEYMKALPSLSFSRWLLIRIWQFSLHKHELYFLLPLNHLDRSSFMEYICYEVCGFPSCLSRHTEPPVLQTWVWLSCNSTKCFHLVLYLTGGFSETLHTMKYVKDITFSSIWFAIYSMFLCAS